jgi:hypothetical protein
MIGAARFLVSADRFEDGRKAARVLRKRVSMNESKSRGCEVVEDGSIREPYEKQETKAWTIATKDEDPRCTRSNANEK